MHIKVQSESILMLLIRICINNSFSTWKNPITRKSTAPIKVG
ncbi:hypothetical protein ES319_A04G109200v1 [Gossypium barbadense]|uniref:Uncharacterized protein n=2 Tax=Gossypium TaxID=3633 RepID=A0A5J5W4J2_GOSBA|nr:hypothetical protein ES319_A04G109200v1 [Gossypium barbadense]TYH22368.1 hypothetical protein ES288_A04G122900v1 [Gossypium darwinii]